MHGTQILEDDMKTEIGRVGRCKVLGSFGIVALAACFAIPATANQAKVFQQMERNGTVTMRVAAPASGGVGWQAVYNFPVPQGKNLLFSYTCPGTAKTPVSGSFNPNAAARVGLSLVANYHPANGQNWGWAINWPSGAPANSRVYFDVYCVQ